MTITLVRGLPGSGKTTYARKNLSDCLRVETDEYFTRLDGKYEFNPAGLGNAHAWCQRYVANWMRNKHPIAVSNTFSQQWEMTVYRLLAEAYHYTVTIIDLFDGGLTDAELAKRNVHGVPEEQIARMRARWEK